MLQDKDKNILELLQENAKLTVMQIAKKLDLRPSTVHDRIKRMERSGIIKKYVAIVDKNKLDYKLTFYQFFKFRPTDFMLKHQKPIMNDKHIQEIQIIDGEWHALIKSVFKTPEDFAKHAIEFRKKYGEHIIDSMSIMSFTTEKESTAVPLD